MAAAQLATGTKSAEDFFVAGLGLLEERGFPAVTTVALCERIGVTRGSFYHHFASFDDYVGGLMTFWVDRWTRDTIAQNERWDSLESRHVNEMAVVAAMPHGAEVALRPWGAIDRTVRAALQQVDALRHEYLVRSYQSLGREPESADRFADLTLAALVGGQLATRPPDARQIATILQTLWDVAKPC